MEEAVNDAQAAALDDYRRLALRARGGRGIGAECDARFDRVLFDAEDGCGEAYPTGQTVPSRRARAARFTRTRRQSERQVRGRGREGSLAGLLPGDFA